jgi:hypothetical protein
MAEQVDNDGLIEQIEAIDSAVAELLEQRNEVDKQIGEHTCRRDELIARLGHDPHPQRPEEAETSWLSVAELVARDRQPAHRAVFLDEHPSRYRSIPVSSAPYWGGRFLLCARVYQGETQLHALPPIKYPNGTPPADQQAACGRRSSNEGQGHEGWFEVEPPRHASTVDLCIDCVTQLDQASRPRSH